MRKCNSFNLVCVGGDKVSSAQYLHYGNHAVIFDLGKNPECTTRCRTGESQRRILDHRLYSRLSW